MKKRAKATVSQGCKVEVALGGPLVPSHGQEFTSDRENIPCSGQPPEKGNPYPSLFTLLNI